MPAVRKTIRATPHDKKIHAVVARIPRGKVSTYGEVADRAGLPRRARLVGQVLSCLPANNTLPWHRVVNAQGGISLPVGGATAKEQRQRLLAEGIVFRGARIELKRYAWRVSLDELLWR